MIEWFTRNTVTANLLMVVILVAGVIGAFDVREEMIPEFELDRINIQVAYLGAASAEIKSAVCIRIEEEFQSIDGIKTITSTASEGMGTVLVELAPSQQRDLSSEQLGRLWREATGTVPGATEVNFNSSMMSPGSDLNIMFAGPNIAELRAAADEVKIELHSYAGVYNITDSFREGKQEMRLDIKSAAETLGLTLQDLGRQVRQAF